MNLYQKPLVLVVNDDEAMRKALQFSLQLEGVEVHVHGGAAELLADGDLSHADCLILKDRLPDMDGFEVMENLRIREILPPTILLTANATSELRARATAGGARLVLEKPILDNVLVEGMLTLLEGGRHADYVESRRGKPNIFGRS